jgi:hypothetical protein
MAAAGITHSSEFPAVENLLAKGKMWIRTTECPSNVSGACSTTQGACAPTAAQWGHLTSADWKRSLKARDRGKQLVAL